jgi:hypothetical protein
MCLPYRAITFVNPECDHVFVVAQSPWQTHGVGHFHQMDSLLPQFDVLSLQPSSANWDRS